MAGHWLANGDLHAVDMVLRRIAWRIEGGVHDGEIVITEDELTEKLRNGPHGGCRPVYIEIGD